MALDFLILYEHTVREYESDLLLKLELERRGYTVRISPMPEPLPADASAQAESAAIVNRAMESLIRQCPQQYLWGYHRYKAPRAGAAD